MSSAAKFVKQPVILAAEGRCKKKKKEMMITWTVKQKEGEELYHQARWAC